MREPSLVSYKNGIAHINFAADVEVPCPKVERKELWNVKAIMIGYFAKLEGDNSIHMDKKELSEVHWFLRNELPHGLSSISLTYDMIEAFRNGVVF